MSIVRAGIYSTVSTIAKLLSSLVIVKLVAWYAGPEGVGKLGQFLSLMSLITVFAGGGITSGVIKYVAEYRERAEEKSRLLQAATSYTLTATAAMGIVIIVFSMPLAEWLLSDKRFHSLILILAIAQLFIAIHNLILAIINGFMDVRRVAIINIAGSVLGLGVTAVLSYYFKLDGALYALVISQAALLMVSYPIFKRSRWFEKSIFYPRIDWGMYQLLARYSIMSLTSAILAPFVQIWVRNHLVSSFSWQDAGYWQAVSKVSDAYLLSITMAISVYYLPKLSAIKDRSALLWELKNAYKYIMPVVCTIAFFVYVYRDSVTLLLFSSEFLKGQVLYAPQLIGDVIKIASFILSYLMLAKAMTKIFILSEIIFSLTYIALVWGLTSKFGLIGVMYAFIINYILYLIFNIFVVRNYIRNMNDIKISHSRLN